MKKSVVLLAIVIVVAGMMAGLRIFVSEDPYDGGQSAGKALGQMERETDRQVENLCKEIEAGGMSQSECRAQVKEMTQGILYNFFNLEDEEGSYLNLAYNCSVIRKLGLRLDSKKEYEEAELELRRDNLSLFSDQVFSYALDVSEESQEEVDYKKLCQWAEEIEANLDQEVERYTERVYAWYGEK